MSATLAERSLRTNSRKSRVIFNFSVNRPKITNNVRCASVSFGSRRLRKNPYICEPESDEIDFLLNKQIMKAELLFLEGIGMSEILVIGLFMLIFFGAKKLPDFMQGLGKGVREFKNSVRDVQSSIENDEPAPKPKPRVTTTPTSTVAKSESLTNEMVAKATPEEGVVKE
jgi:sec-independent protein translocase protein TatA